ATWARFATARTAARAPPLDARPARASWPAARRWSIRCTADDRIEAAKPGGPGAYGPVQGRPLYRVPGGRGHRLDRARARLPRRGRGRRPRPGGDAIQPRQVGEPAPRPPGRLRAVSVAPLRQPAAARPGHDGGGGPRALGPVHAGPGE